MDEIIRYLSSHNVLISMFCEVLRFYLKDHFNNIKISKNIHIFH